MGDPRFTPFARRLLDPPTSQLGEAQPQVGVSRRHTPVYLIRSTEYTRGGESLLSSASMVQEGMGKKPLLSDHAREREVTPYLAHTILTIYTSDNCINGGSRHCSSQETSRRQRGLAAASGGPACGRLRGREELAPARVTTAAPSAPPRRRRWGPRNLHGLGEP